MLSSKFIYSLLPQKFEEGISVLLRQKLSGPCMTEKLMFCTQYCVTKLTARVSNLPEKNEMKKKTNSHKSLSDLLSVGDVMLKH